MAIVYEERVSKVQSFQCDRCKKTKPVSLKDALATIRCGGGHWLFMENDRVLCPDCVRAIIDFWYQRGDLDFQLQGSGGDSNKKKKAKRVVA